MKAADDSAPASAAAAIAPDAGAASAPGALWSSAAVDMRLSSDHRARLAVGRWTFRLLVIGVSSNHLESRRRTRHEMESLGLESSARRVCGPPLGGVPGSRVGVPCDP